MQLVQQDYVVALCGFLFTARVLTLNSTWVKLLAVSAYMQAIDAQLYVFMCAPRAHDSYAIRHI